MKVKLCTYLIAFYLILLSPCVFGWARHDLLTKLAIEKVDWLNTFDSIQVTSFQEFLSKAFSKDFTQKDFLKQYQLNPTTKIELKESQGSTTNAKSILISYTDEPDWGIDQNMDISPDQKFMGGTKGPTSQAFRHLFWKQWSVMAPWKTFHVPPREMGQAPHRAQLYYDLAQKAFEVGSPYWAFRFLAWSLHYIQDLGQPFHSTQLLTPKFIAWDSLFNLEMLIKRTTQIISNYHFMYEDYVVYKIEQELNHGNSGLFASSILGQTFMNSSSAYLIARHSADASNRFSYQIGENSFTFFGRKFLDPKIDVPNSPKGRFPLKEFDETAALTQEQKQLFLKNTAQSLSSTAYFTRSLLELSREEFLKKK